MTLPFASFGKSKNISFWHTDKLWGSKSIRILPGIHFWGLQYPQIKFRVSKRTFSFLDILPWIFRSSLEHSQITKPQSFGASNWPQQHQYFFVVMLGRRDNYVELDSMKKCFYLTPYCAAVSLIQSKWYVTLGMMNFNHSWFCPSTLIKLDEF